MSSPRYHIPFPKNWLSLNAPLKTTAGPVTAAPQTEVPTHSFLSNRNVNRSASMSSTLSSASSTSSAPGSPPTKAADANPIGNEGVPSLQGFLTLNTKFVAPPSSAAGLVASPGSAEKHSFLSNKA